MSQDSSHWPSMFQVEVVRNTYIATYRCIHMTYMSCVYCNESIDSTAARGLAATPRKGTKAKLLTLIMRAGTWCSCAQRLLMISVL